MHRHLTIALLVTLFCGAAAILPAQAGGLVADDSDMRAVSGTQGFMGATTRSATGVTVDAPRNPHAVRHIRYRPNATAHAASDAEISADSMGDPDVNSSTDAGGETR